MSGPYTLKDVELEIRRIAAENPDFRYSRGAGYDTCVYVPTKGNPQGCIVGAALSALVPGVDLTEFHSTNGDKAARAVLDIDPASTYGDTWILKVQNSQDEGFSWSESVRRADEARR